VVVVVPVVRGVAMSVVDVVHVVTMGDRDMSASLAVGVVMLFVGSVLPRFALVPVAFVAAVQVSVVDVVDVVAVRDGDVPASLAVCVGMRLVCGVCRCHESRPLFRPVDSSKHADVLMSNPAWGTLCHVRRG
jgi:hypothetical protein